MQNSHPHLLAQTRWGDNDQFGHVNNVVYHSYADTVLNHFLIHKAGLDQKLGPIVNLCVANGFHFFFPVAYPELIHAGLNVHKIGNTSVTFHSARMCV
jgi:acyl-CoA thioester hydrolase